MMASNLTGALLPVIPSANGQFIAGLFNNRLTISLSTEPGKGHVIRTIDTKNHFAALPRFIRWSPRRSGSLETRPESQRILCASGKCIFVWDLDDEKWSADIQDVDSAGHGGVVNVEFGATHDEVIAFHGFGTKVTIFSLKTGQAQAIKSPKFSHSSGFSYRPGTGHFAILLKLEAVDTLTVHETETYEVISTVALPTVDAQGLKWSPNGCWLAVWDTASVGTKVIIYTADGQLFKTFTGRGEDRDYNLGVRVITWSPTSQVLAIGNNDGSVDFLRGDTFTLKTSIFHSVEANQQARPEIWRERHTEADGSSHYGPATDLSSLSAGSSNTSRNVTSVEFNSNGTMIATLSQAFPNVVWLWTFVDSLPKLTTILIQEHNIRQLLWNPIKPDTLLVTNEGNPPTVHEWTIHCKPRIAHVPIKPDNGKYEATWLEEMAESSLFLFGSTREYLVGRFYLDSEEFETVQSWADSSHISSASRLFDTSVD